MFLKEKTGKMKETWNHYGNEQWNPTQHQVKGTNPQHKQRIPFLLLTQDVCGLGHYFPHFVEQRQALLFWRRVR